MTSSKIHEKYKNKVILYYKNTGWGGKSHEMKHEIFDKDQILECVDQEGNVYQIPAHEAKQTRSTFPLDLDSIFNTYQQIHDDHYCRMGYAYLMKYDSTKGHQIKLPNKDISQLFNVDDEKKKSIWITDFHDIFAQMENIIEEYDLRKINSIIRGLFSAKTRIVPGNKGYLSFKWDKLGEKQKEQILNLFENYHNKKTEFNMEYNGGNIFVQSRDSIHSYIKDIGFIQRSKTEQAIKLYRTKLRIINNVIPIDKDYLIYHVGNFGDPRYYEDPDLLSSFDVNFRNRRMNTCTPLIASLVMMKHSSLYPFYWLVQNGARIDQETIMMECQCKKKHKSIFTLCYDIVDKYKYYRKSYFYESFPYLMKIISYSDKKITLDNSFFISRTLHHFLKDEDLREFIDETLDFFRSYFDGKTILHDLLSKSYKNSSLSYKTLKYFYSKLIGISEENLNDIMNQILDNILFYVNEKERDFIPHHITETKTKNDVLSSRGKFYSELKYYIPFYYSLKDDYKVKPDTDRLNLINRCLKDNAIYFLREDNYISYNEL